MIPWKTKALKEEITRVKNCTRNTTCIGQLLSWEKFSEKASDAIQQETRGGEWVMIAAFTARYLMRNCVD